MESVLVRTSASGRQSETEVAVRVGAGKEEVRREHVGVLEPVLGRGTALVPGGGRRPGRARAAAELQLVAVVERADDRVGRVDLAVRLDRRVLQDRVVGKTGRRVLLDVVLTPATPEEQAILDRGAAGLEADVLDLPHLRPGELGLEVRRVQFALNVRLRLRQGAAEVAVALRVVEPRRTTELVAAALRHQIDLDAGAVLRHVRTAGRERHLGELVEVVVGRRGAGGRHVGNRRAVHLEVVLVAPDARSAEGGLLARLRTADVHPVDEYARRLREQGPGIARGRDLLQFDLAHVGAGRELPFVEQRALGSDGDRLFKRGCQNQRHARVAAEGDNDVRELDAAKAIELSCNGVGAGIEGEETPLALAIGELRTRRADAADGDRDAGKRGAGLVRHRAVEIARRRLAKGHAGDEQAKDDAERRNEASTHALNTPSKVCSAGNRRRSRDAERPPAVWEEPDRLANSTRNHRKTCAKTAVGRPLLTVGRNPLCRGVCGHVRVSVRQIGAPPRTDRFK